MLTVANEIGYWAAGAGGSTQLMFVGGGGASVASLIYTAPANATITHVRGWRASGGGATANFKIALFATSAGAPTGAALQSVTINTVNEGVEFGSDVSWALTNANTYAIAVEPLDGPINMAAGVLTNGCAIANAAFTSAWSTAVVTNVRLELAADVTISGGGSTTITPGKATLTLAGNAATINTFTKVAIKEVFINEAGSPVTNRTGMSLLVWYGGSPIGAPDLSYSALTTDAAGTASWSLAPGSLIFNQTIFYVATDGGASLSQYTCARMIPTYT